MEITVDDKMDTKDDQEDGRSKEEMTEEQKLLASVFNARVLEDVVYD